MQYNNKRLFEDFFDKILNEGILDDEMLDADKIFKLTKERFGVTYRLLEAGYILPDGSLLDFSGRHQDPDNPDYFNNSRTVDHRDIYEIEYDENDEPTGVELDMQQFIRLGAIRIDANSGNINLFRKPTDKQFDIISRIVRRNDGCVIVDFGDSETTDCYIEYDEGTKYQRVIADIKRYFDEGIYPQGSEHY